MSKSHPFSIYLLKPARNATNSLREDHSLELFTATHLPEGAILYVLDAHPRPPWWREYFGIEDDLFQEHKGALILLPVSDRWFAISFGQVFHHLDDTSYEYDFGLRVTLNSLDPKELKSADMVEPGAARRKRTQVPVSTDLTFLDFDGNSEIIKSLTGTVKEQYRSLFKNATGSVALKVSLKLEPQKLSEICEALLELYNKEDFKASFPNIQNISPVKDPQEISKLDSQVLDSIQRNDGRTTLAIPDIIDYRDNTCCMFSGEGETSAIFPDISMEYFLNFLGSEFDYATLTIERIKSFRMLLTDVEGHVAQPYNLYRALIFETHQSDDGAIFHLCEGCWYRFEADFVARLTTYIDEKCNDTDLCAYNHDAIVDGKPVYSEANYNAALPNWNERFICLDRSDISPSGNSPMEPCDLYTIDPDATARNGYRGKLYHVKISTRSSQLSHLFNQGLNAIEMISINQESKRRMTQLIRDRIGANNEEEFLSPLDSSEFKLIFGVITHKDKRQKSRNLPLFSKISLMRVMQRCDLMKIPCELTFIEDQSDAKRGHSKNPQILAEVCSDGTGRKEIRPVAGQEGFDPTRPIKRCPRAISESPIGMRYRLTVSVSPSGDLTSYHSWPFEVAA